MKAWPIIALAALACLSVGAAEPDVREDSPHLQSGTADLDREAVIENLGRAYDAAVARIRAEEQAAWEAAPKPSLQYVDRYAAVMRYVEGVELTEDVWSKFYRSNRTNDPEEASRYGQYPPGSETSAALNELKVDILTRLPSKREALAERYEQLNIEWARYENARHNASVDRANAAMRGDPMPEWTGEDALWAKYGPKIEEHRGFMARHEASIQAYCGDLAYWDSLEADYREAEAAQVAAVRKHFSDRTARRIAALSRSPGYAFLVEHRRLSEQIESATSVTDMIRTAAHTTNSKERRAELLAKAEARDAGIAAKRAELAALTDAYFATRPAGEPADTPMLVNR